jgi:hypothetical protein
VSPTWPTRLSRSNAIRVFGPPPNATSSPAKVVPDVGTSTACFQARSSYAAVAHPSTAASRVVSYTSPKSRLPYTTGPFAKRFHVRSLVVTVSDVPSA